MQCVGAFFVDYLWMYTYNEWICWDCGQNRGKLITSKNLLHPKLNEWFTKEADG